MFWEFGLGPFLWGWGCRGVESWWITPFSSTSSLWKKFARRFKFIDSMTEFPGYDEACYAGWGKSERVQAGEVDNLQSAQQKDPLTGTLFQEMQGAQNLKDKRSGIEESILKHKSTMHWLQCGDRNSKCFYASLLARISYGLHI